MPIVDKGFLSTDTPFVGFVCPSVRPPDDFYEDEGDAEGEGEERRTTRWATRISKKYNVKGRSVTETIRD